LDTLPVSVDISVPPASPRTNITSACFHPSTSTVSRLVSLVEIIKREYLKSLASTRLHGLHQYNEIGTLEDLGLRLVVSSSYQKADANELESAREVEAISGKHLLVLSSHLALYCLLNWNRLINFFQHTAKRNKPFRRITLSTIELPEFVEKNTTYEAVTHLY
jgi:hypothetical protein